MRISCQKTLGVLFLSALLLLLASTAMAGDQIRDRGRDQDQDRLHDCLVMTTMGGDRLHTRDRLRDESCLLDKLECAQNSNQNQWRYVNRYQLNGNVPPISQGTALMPIWLIGF